jgi:hypothetical protein
MRTMIKTLSAYPKGRNLLMLIAALILALGESSVRAQTNLPLRSSWPGVNRGTPVGVFVTNQLAYVANGSGGLVVFDVSNPARPEIVGGSDVTGTSLNVLVSGNYAAVAAGVGGVQFVSVSNSSSLSVLGSYTNVAGNDVDVVGNYAYLAGDTVALTSLLITNLANPVKIGVFGTNARTYWRPIMPAPSV